jgi:glycosyltransferase involved in cell wall biosynthesis
MVGDGPERSHAERLAQELNVAPHVYFLGMQLDVEEIFRMADVYLQPSQTESFGLTVLEASAAGIPAIATNVGGLPEVVSDGETGFLLPLGDVDGMSARAIELLKNKELRQSMGQKARQRALTLFSAERVVGMYMDLYKKVLDK